MAYSCHISVPRVIAVAGYDENFVGWGLEDQEFAFRADAAGARFEFQPTPPVLHIEPAVLRDPFRADDVGLRGSYNSFVLNAGRFFLKHSQCSEVEALLLSDLTGLEYESGEWRKSANGADPELVLEWAIHELGRV